jgi:diguanylate cyclase (GGDEF)-like protein
VATIYLENQQQDKALQLLSSTLQDTLNTNYPRIIAEYYSLLAQAHWLNNNTMLTKQFALEALENENKEGTTVAKVLSYKLLFEVSQAEGNYELALLYHQKYAIADKLYYDETQAKNLAFQLAQHQAIEQENKIDLLNEKNALLTSEKALLTAEQALTRAYVENSRLIIMVLALTLLVLAFWGYRLLKAHKRIKELAEYDALTGIFNRGHFTQVANNALRYCQSAKQELSVIMFDLDYFKKINDTYGHACGDWALKAAVDACKSIGRQNDIFARLGGEEFCILLTSCNNEAAQHRAEACRQAIADIDSADSGFEFTITASFGITDTNTSGFELEKLLADADSAAYRAKRAGRNQTTIFRKEATSAKVIPLDATRDAF